MSTAMSGPVVAIGGAEFSMRSENEALHDYVLSLAPVELPRICLLPTAGGDRCEQIAAFHQAMGRRTCAASTLSLFRLGQERIDPAEHLAAQDVIYVGGGSMVNLLALWKEHGIEALLHHAHRRGAVLCGPTGRRERRRTKERARGPAGLQPPPPPRRSYQPSASRRARSAAAFASASTRSRISLSSSR